ncbi:HNH endonuclease [Paraglaciecola sp.]|uniref:HNH endonuclease n=1 Tax=Paraglaciecola sp. TaxID=1920173 RepID=UPI003EF98656
MPIRPGKACRAASCPNIASASKYHGFCEEHKDRGGWYGNERDKGNDTARGYGWAWRKLSKLIKERDKGLCQEHKRKGIFKAGSQVDHIKPREQGGNDEHSNLELLCNDCHRTKTATERIRK